MMNLKRLFSTLCLLALAACGGGGGSGGTSSFGGGSGGGTGGGGTTTPTVTLELKLLDAAGNSTSNVLAGQPLRAQALLKRNGTAVADEIIQFTIEQAGELVKIEPSAGSQLTDASGTALVTVSSLGTLSGAGRIRASTTVSNVAATAAANFFTSGSTTTPPASLTLSPLTIGSTSVSAYGTTGVTVTVLQNSVPYTAGPVTVNFTTSCPAGRATITSSTTTLPNGTAVGTFVDNGCAQTADAAVTITASISSSSQSGLLTVRSPSTGSLRFLSVVPADKSITLRGQGGNGRQENATVTFQLVDVAGQGVGNADVCFDITTYIGGLNVDGFGPTTLPSPQGSNALCGDPAADNLSKVRYVKRTNPDGTVAVQINSGTVPTPVRVRARALYPSGTSIALESFSDTLSVSTGLPLQRSFSLSIDKANIDGGDFDGEIASLTVRLADQFSNPVPDGTVVNFIGSGAAVCTANNGSCRTTNGACSCNVVSQARRPMDNRVVVTAYAVGLEDFDDTNGDNLYTLNADGFNLAGGALPLHDLGDAYVDANKDGRAGDGSATAGTNPTINLDTDILIPYRVANQYSRDGDGARSTAHIRSSTVIYLSKSSSLGDPTVVLPLVYLSQENPLQPSGSPSSFFVRLAPGCPAGTPVPQTTFTAYLDDGIGNPMAAATGVAVADASTNISAGPFRPASVLAIGARGPLASADLPNVPKTAPWSPISTNIVATPHAVTVRGVEDKCSGNASFSMQVTSPRGGPASARILYEGEPRITSRGAFDVRYRDPVNFSLLSLGGRVAEVSNLTWVGPANGPAAASLRVNWGDGTSDTYTNLAALPSPLTRTYTTSGIKTITITVTAGTSTYANSQSVNVLP